MTGLRRGNSGARAAGRLRDSFAMKSAALFRENYAMRRRACQLFHAFHCRVAQATSHRRRSAPAGALPCRGQLARRKISRGLIEAAMMRLSLRLGSFGR